MTDKPKNLKAVDFDIHNIEVLAQIDGTVLLALRQPIGQVRGWRLTSQEARSIGQVLQETADLAERLCQEKKVH